MGCSTWFFRPIKEGEIPSDTCEYSEEIYGDDRYTSIDTPHNLFRVRNYPEDKLLSLKETLDFIEKNKDSVTFDYDWEARLIAFWDKNPDGVIEFG